MSFSRVQDHGRQFLDFGGSRRERWWKYLSSATVVATGVIAKGFIKIAMKDIQVENLDILLEAKRRSEQENRGLVTYMNHMSLLDDPFIWGILPFDSYLNPDNVRWSLGADNVCFKNKFLTTFFSLGKVLPTSRFGAGPFQGSMDASVALLSGYDTNQSADPRSNLPTEYYIRNYTSPALQSLTTSSEHRNNDSVANATEFKSNWVHIFPEAFVHQVYPPHRYTLRYFKWGASRLLLESTRPPIVVPIYAYGFDNVIPEDKEDDYNILKTRGKSTLRVKVGKPLDDEEIAQLREEWVNLVKKHKEEEVKKEEQRIGWKETAWKAVPKASWLWSSSSPNLNPSVNSNVVPIIAGDMDTELREGKLAQELRSKVALYLRAKLEELRVSFGFEPEKLDFGNPEFWNPVTGGCRDVPVMGDVNKLDTHKDLNLFHLLKEELNIKTPFDKMKKE